MAMLVFAKDLFAYRRIYHVWMKIDGDIQKNTLDLLKNPRKNKK